MAERFPEKRIAMLSRTASPKMPKAMVPIMPHSPIHLLL
jgi:hypothetical protein